MSSDTVYLDYAAATPLDREVLAAMTPLFSEQFYNPSALYTAAKSARQTIETARVSVAHWLGTRPSEIVFTAGGTEANNLAIHGIMRRYPDASCVVSGIEHDSVLMPAQQHDCRIAPVLPDGRLDIEKLEVLIDDSTVLVSVMYANNEVGTIQPIRELAMLLETIRAERRASGNKRPILLHTDACQAANYLDLHVARLGVDLMTLNGGKVYGPKQSGALYVKGGLQLKPLIDGGGQEHGLRSGTEAAASIVGFASALEAAQKRRKAETERLRKLRDDFMDRLQAAIPSVRINGSMYNRLPNNVHITIPATDNERLLIQLDARGIQAAAGSACSASRETPSHVLRAMGLSDRDARASLRLTMGRQTTPEQIERTVSVLSSLV
jgi:cysteine desulfurase